MSWWRAQRRSLIALVLAAAAVVSVQFWFQVRPTIDADTPPPILAEGSAELGGHRLTLESTRWDEFAAPDGSRTLSIRLRAHSAPDSERCRQFSLSETTGERLWVDAGSAIDDDADDAERDCQDDSPSYRILAIFLLPEDAEGPFWLDVPIGEAFESLRFRIGD